MDRTVRKTESYLAKGSDGKTYTINKWQTFTIPDLISGSRSEVPGNFDLKLSDGRSLEDTDDPEVFKILGTDIIVRKV